tara:strand:+ start:134 stop:808 length:675 start_codon:yes stop_codon:yes gene_type:complete
MSLHKIVKKYTYKKHNRFQSEQGRKYLVDEIGVPSVTTILSATKDKKFLDDWRRRVGNQEADNIMKQASTRGTEMHRVLEYYYNGAKYFNEMEEGIKPRKMASVIIDNLNVQEVWGNEVSLAYNKDFAGTTDLVALSYDKPTIIDFKQANKPKREDWIEDYKCQLGAYYLAHKTHYGPIELGIISIATRDLQYQEFKLSEAVLREYADKFLERLEIYKKTLQKG